jgi:ABC-type Fe3+ transport system permease subunit
VSDISHSTQEERPGLRRIAWILVITMTVLIALALVAVVLGFVRRGRDLARAHESAIAAPAAAAGALATLTLAPGARIVSVATGNGRLVLHLTRDGRDEVQVIDMASGAVVQEIQTRQ